ncbi:protein kinase [Lysinibacillus sp. RS5]|uniref:protein kinase n=1 Tax=unclassified Lysinibacillus TaxID=2636778 RepID=UPI0035BE8E30
MKNVIEIVRNVDQLMIPENFVGIGSTRKVFRFKHWVIKKHLHEIGYIQSQNEQKIHQALKKVGLANYIAPILYLDEKISIQPYVQTLPLVNGETFDIDYKTDLRISVNLKEAIEEIERAHDGFDFLDSSNYGEDDQSQLILIDY